VARLGELRHAGSFLRPAEIAAACPDAGGCWTSCRARRRHRRERRSRCGNLAPCAGTSRSDRDQGRGSRGAAQQPQPGAADTPSGPLLDAANGSESGLP